MAPVRAMLFTHLADDLFRPLASPSRAFNSALLLHLHARVFADAAEPLRKPEILSAIGAFAAGWTQAEIADDETTPSEPVERRSAIYRRLIEAGWLNERRERYVPVVDFDPDARLLLEDLARLDRGETRSYGGAVLDVLGALESATAHPAERSQALPNAAKAAREFVAHLRGIAAAMRKVEERILRAPERQAAFRLYFEDFVARHLVSDYRTLHTRFNPFRFRSKIVREAARALRDPLTIHALAEAGVREGRAADLAEAERNVRRDLTEILGIFEKIDPHLDAVAEIVARLERRMASSLHASDRRDSGRLDRARSALRALGRATAPGEAPAPPIALLRAPIGTPHLYTPRLPRRAIAAAPLPDARIDPTVEAFVRAKDDFRRRTSVTLESIGAFLDARLGPAARLSASDLAPEDVDAFVVFQRLREIDVLFDAGLSQRFRVERLPGRLDTGWLDCPDFAIRRAEAAQESA